MGRGQFHGERSATAQLEQFGIVASGQIGSVSYQRLNGHLAAQGTSVIHERHRYEVVAEEKAFYTYEREHPRELSGLIPCGEVDAFVTEHPCDDALPLEEMEVRPPGLGTDEAIPVARRAGEIFNSDQ